MLGSAGSVTHLEKFAAALQQSFARATVARARRARPARGPRRPLGVPQRLGARGRVPDAHQGVARRPPRRRRPGDAGDPGRPAEHRRWSPPSRPPPRHRPPSCSWSSATSPACRATSAPRRSTRSIESARRALDSGGLRAVVRDTTRALDLLGAPQRGAARRPRRSGVGALAAAHPAGQRVRRPAQLRRGPRRPRRGDGRGHRRRRPGHRGRGPPAARHDAPRHRQDGAGPRRARPERGDPARPRAGRTCSPRRCGRAGFIELFGGSLVDAEWFFGEADALFRELGDRRGHGLGRAAPRLDRVPVRRLRGGPREPAALGGDAGGARRPQRRRLGARPAGLRRVLPVPLRRRRGAGHPGRRRGRGARRRVGRGDDADPAGQPAPVAGAARRRRGARRAGPQAVPQAGRPLRPEPGDGPAAARPDRARAHRRGAAHRGGAVRRCRRSPRSARTRCWPSPARRCTAATARWRPPTRRRPSPRCAPPAARRASRSSCWRMALAQCDRLDEAVAALESLPDPEWDHPFAHAVGSLVLRPAARRRQAPWPTPRGVRRRRAPARTSTR